jgi:hypothetical protein
LVEKIWDIKSVQDVPWGFDALFPFCRDEKFGDKVYGFNKNAMDFFFIPRLAQIVAVCLYKSLGFFQAMDGKSIQIDGGLPTDENVKNRPF